MHSIIRNILLMAFFTVLAGFVYPVLCTGLAMILFPEKAAGSLIMKQNKPIGSRLIGRPASGPGYLQLRPSASAYNAMPGMASNLGMTSRTLQDSIKARIAFWQNNYAQKNIPPEMLCASGSGLDPHISPQAAAMQAQIIARSRNMDIQTVMQYIRENTEYPFMGILGSSRVNVMAVNLALDSSGHRIQTVK
jgi:K+-transporting ATPase ATPase C chain